MAKISIWMFGLDELLIETLKEMMAGKILTANSSK